MGAKFVTESLCSLSAPERLDEDKGIAYGVRILNPESDNGNVYPHAMVKRHLAAFENAPCYIGHRKNARDHDDPLRKFGIHRNVRESKDGTGFVSDLHYNPGHSFAGQFVWACKNNPALYSLSQHAAVKWAAKRRGDGKRVAESYDEVASIDIVSIGGTTKGVYESSGDGSMLDAKAIADQMTDQDALAGFLSDLFDALPATPFTADVKTAVLTDLMNGLDATKAPADDAPPAAAMAATESLKRFGPFGKWAAKKLKPVFETEALNAGKARVKKLCEQEGLDARFVTESFQGALAGLSDDMARALIADKMATVGVRKGAKTSAPDRGGPAGGDDVDVKDLVKKAFG